MTRSGLTERLRPGRDPNDSFWAILRYSQDWAAAANPDIGWDPAVNGLTLAPRARPELAADWLPLAPIAGPDGTLYRSAPDTGQILRQRACDTDFAPLTRIGGTGHATGHFHTPAGIAFDNKGHLYVADAGNARIQVIDVKTETVIAILDHGLRLPVHMGIGSDGTILVTDAGTGKVHAFSSLFLPCGTLTLATLDPLTGQPWAANPPPRPLAISILPDGTIAVFDPLRPMLWHMTTRGEPLPALGWFDDHLPPGWSPTPRRHAATADVILGPIDGGTHDLAWHRIEIDATTPPGTALEVQSFASNEPDSALRAWAPEHPLPMPRATADARDRAFDRLVLSDQSLWRFWQLGRLTRARPLLTTLTGDGPNASNTLTLPRAAADRLRPGDSLRLVTPTGGEAHVEVASIAATRWSVAATGEPTAFDPAAAVTLIERDHLTPAFGPVDLGFLTRQTPGALTPSRIDGRSGDLALPAAYAGILTTGDVIALQHDAAQGRLELIEAQNETVEITLTAPVIGDFSTCNVILEDSPGRLHLQDTLPRSGPLPTGSQITVISDDHVNRAPLHWADASTGTLWFDDSPSPVTAQNWTNAQVPEPAATDRGRYLWLRLRLTGRGLPPPSRIGPPVTATASPVIRSLRITAPRYSLLHWLPAIFARQDPALDPPGGSFLERFLSLFEDQLTEAEAAFESISRLINPRAADADWLDFVAGWLDLAFDPSWPIANRRQLVIEGAALQSARGTPAALRRYLEIYTGGAVAVTEDFRQRPPDPIQLGARGALGIAPLGGGDPAPDLAHRFSVTLALPGRNDRRTEISAIRKIIDDMKPAHTDYRLNTDGTGSARIGTGAAIGTIVIPPPGITPPCTCDPEAAASNRAQPGALAQGGFRLGGKLGHGPITEHRSQGGADVQMA